MTFSNQYGTLDTEFFTRIEDVISLIPYLDRNKKYIEPFDRANCSKFAFLKNRGFDIVLLHADFDCNDDYEGRVIVTNPPFISRARLYAKMARMTDEMYLIMPEFTFNAYTKYRNKDRCRRWTDEWNKYVLYKVVSFDTPSGEKKMPCVMTHWIKKEGNK